MNEKMYSTGEFAKLCGVKKQTLFHYDHIGLLRPAHVDDKGYRLYSYSQYEDFLMISCLKEAGMPLKDIAVYLDLDDESARNDALAACIESLDGRIEHLERVRRVLASSFMHDGQCSTAAKESDKDTTLLLREKREMWASTRLDVLDDQQLVEVVADLIKTAEPSVICLPSELVLEGDLDTQSYLLVADEAIRSESSAEELGLTRFTIPGGRYAQIELYPDENTGAVYQRLLDDIALIHCHPGEYFYEELPDEKSAPEGSPTIVSTEIFADDDAGETGGAPS